MNPSLLQRQAALAGVALLAAVGALALGRDDSVQVGDEPPPAAASWRSAHVGIHASAGRASGCPAPIGAATEGIVHPVLPCGVKVVVSAGGRSLRTEVVGRGPVGRRHEFDLTAALARTLGVTGETVVRWRFAD